MTLSAIVYSESSAAVVSRYEADQAKSSTYWSHKDVTPVRQEIKSHYRGEQQYLCCYCAIPDPSSHGLDWDVEHIAPKRLHPAFLFTPLNLAVACRECNGHKGQTETLVDPLALAYPGTSAEFLIVHPHFDEWSDHILRNHLTYASFTDKGAWTIKKCRLNRFDERNIGLRFPISDARFEEPVRRLLVGNATLQDVLDQIEHSVHPN